MNNVKKSIEILKNTPEPFSVDGIIKSFEISSKKIIKNFAIYFDKEANKTPNLWYASSGFKYKDADLAKRTVDKNIVIYKDGYVSFPLFARGTCFGAIIINMAAKEESKGENVDLLIDYLSMILYSEKLSFIANRDKLTSLYNRGYILKLLNKKEEKKEIYSIIIIDLDRFKYYNDRYGHNIGDHILKIASKSMKISLSRLFVNTVLARYGGEEFIIAANVQDRKTLYDVMETVRNEIAQNDFSTDEYSLKATASLGGAIKDSYMTLESLIDKADKALYKAKEEGRNKSVIL